MLVVVICLICCCLFALDCAWCGLYVFAAACWFVCFALVGKLLSDVVFGCVIVFAVVLWLLGFMWVVGYLLWACCYDGV